MSTILSQRRLRLLGHLARMDDHRLPKKLLVSAPAGGSRAVGGQKLRWNDLISRDLRESGISDTWYNQAQDRTTWHSMCRTKLEDVNKQRENVEKVRKDERKKRCQNRSVAREALKCVHPGCNFVAINQSGLVNHNRQKHAPVKATECSYCGRTFNQQRLHNHQRFCKKRPT